MPQVVGVWCEAEGHQVTFVCYTGFEDLVAELPADVDLVFIGACTEAGLRAYALSHLFRSRGAVTVLGGPHARCSPEDARRYFDYVLGFTDRSVIRDVLQDCAPHRPLGVHRAAPRQPVALPGVRERSKFIEPTLRKAPVFKIVPMLGSLGCPYTCSVCMILRHIPYVQTSFVLGVDSDSGPEPCELTKRFVDRTPGAFPGYSLLSAFGRAAPLNLEYQRTDRVLPFPFHFLDNNHAMNVKPQNYSWQEFYDHVIDLTRYTFSRRAIVRRFRATKAPIPRWMNVVRAVSSEGYGRIRYHSEVRQRLGTDGPMRRYFDPATTELPAFYANQGGDHLGPLWHWLPHGALTHDHHAYLKAETTRPPSAAPTA